MEQGRLFKIVYHLLDKGRATAPELAEKFEVSVRTMAYAVKMAYKKTAKGEYDDFAVYPLEGVWQKIENCELIKEKLRYTLVIRQPDFVGEGGVCAALERTKHRKPNPLLEEVRFGIVPGETYVQLLHVGAYDDEPVSFAKMDEFVHAHSLTRAEESHREIYLSNATRTEKNRLKTILRYRVK